MAYEVEIPKRVSKQLDALPGDAGQRLRDDFEAYAADPLDPGVDLEKIKGTTDTFRIRCGDYRLTFERDKKSKTLLALRAADRKEVYKG